jgi:hypothetical protein
MDGKINPFFSIHQFLVLIFNTNALKKRDFLCDVHYATLSGLPLGFLLG